MIEPRQNIVDGLDARHRGQRRPAQHDDRKAERARRRDLAVGRGAAAVLAHHDLDAMLRQQGTLVGLGKRPARGDADRAAAD